jgi:hypothetical protein
VAASIDHAQAALAAARGAGFAVERAEVASVASNVLVRLEPGPFAARLTGATEGFRDSAANLRREARLAAALAAAGAPVPARLGGPYEAAGRSVTLWPWLELQGEAGDAGEAGRARRVHGNDFGWAQSALLAHGGPFDAALMEACVDARVAQGAAYLAATGRGDVSGHLEWLRERAS